MKAKERRQLLRDQARDISDIKKEEQHEREEAKKERVLQRKRSRRAKEELFEDS